MKWNIYTAKSSEQPYAYDIDCVRWHKVGFKCKVMGDFIFLGRKLKKQYSYSTVDISSDDVFEIDQTIEWMINREIFSSRKDMICFCNGNAGAMACDENTFIFRVDTINNIYVIRMNKGSIGHSFCMYVYDRQSFTINN